MSRIISFRGKQYSFPDNATDEQIAAALQGQQQGPQQAPGAPAQPAQASQATPPPLLSSGLAREGLQGLTFGFGDELTAGARAAWDAATNGQNFVDAYSRNVADERAQLKQYESAHPGASLGANLVGGLPLMFVPGLNVGRGATLGRTLLNAARTGATTGAIAGLGSGEGDVGSRVRRAVTGGFTGSLLGAGIPVLGRGGSRAMQAVSDMGAGSWVGRVAGALPGVTAPGAARAEEKVLEALQRDGLSVDDAVRIVNEWKATGKPFTLADVAGMNTRGVADAAMTVPNPVRNQVNDQLTGRAADQGERIATDLSRRTGVLSDAFDTATKISAQRAAQARPLYDAAYKAGANSITDPRILRILELPQFRSVLKRAADIAELEGNPLPVYKAADGTERFVPNLRTLDYVKRGLDDELFSGKVTGSMGRAEQSALKDVRGQMLDILDAKYPEYAKARAVYAGQSRSLEALEAGKQFWNADPREIRDQLANEFKTPAERDHFLLGAVDQIRGIIRAAPDGVDIHKRIFGSPQRRDLLRMLFPNQKTYDDFVQAMSVEKAMRLTQDAIRGNSRTMSRAAEVAGLGSDTALDMITDPKKALLNSLADRLFGRVTGENAEAALPLLFADPMQQLQRLRVAQDRLSAAAERPLATAPGMGIIGGLLGQ